MAIHANQDVITRVLARKWDWLDKNFHKLSTEQKIKICMELCKRNIPQELNFKGELRLELSDRIVSARQEIFQN